MRKEFTEWFDISTAPKDGKQILLCSKERTIQIGWWVKSKQKWAYGGGEWGDNVELWTNIPEPPSKGKNND